MAKKINKFGLTEVSSGRDAGNGSRFPILRKSNDIVQEGKREANLAVIFTGAPQEGINMASTSRIKNASEGKNPLRNAKNKRQNQAQKE